MSPVNIFGNKPQTAVWEEHHQCVSNIYFVPTIIKIRDENQHKSLRQSVTCKLDFGKDLLFALHVQHSTDMIHNAVEFGSMLGTFPEMLL